MKDALKTPKLHADKKCCGTHYLKSLLEDNIKVYVIHS